MPFPKQDKSLDNQILTDFLQGIDNEPRVTPMQLSVTLVNFLKNILKDRSQDKYSDYFRYDQLIFSRVLDEHQIPCINNTYIISNEHFDNNDGSLFELKNSILVEDEQVQKKIIFNQCTFSNFIIEDAIFNADVVWNKCDFDHTVIKNVRQKTECSTLMHDCTSKMSFQGSKRFCMAEDMFDPRCHALIFEKFIQENKHSSIIPAHKPGLYLHHCFMNFFLGDKSILSHLSIIDDKGSGHYIHDSTINSFNLELRTLGGLSNFAVSKSVLSSGVVKGNAKSMHWEYAAPFILESTLTDIQFIDARDVFVEDSKLYRIKAINSGIELRNDNTDTFVFEFFPGNVIDFNFGTLINGSLKTHGSSIEYGPDIYWREITVEKVKINTSHETLFSAKSTHFNNGSVKGSASKLLWEDSTIENVEINTSRQTSFTATNTHFKDVRIVSSLSFPSFDKVKMERFTFKRMVQPFFDKSELIDVDLNLGHFDTRPPQSVISGTFHQTQFKSLAIRQAPTQYLDCNGNTFVSPKFEDVDLHNVIIAAKNGKELRKMQFDDVDAHNLSVFLCDDKALYQYCSLQQAIKGSFFFSPKIPDAHFNSVTLLPSKECPTTSEASVALWLMLLTAGASGVLLIAKYCFPKKEDNKKSSWLGSLYGNFFGGAPSEQNNEDRVDYSNRMSSQ